VFALRNAFDHSMAARIIRLGTSLGNADAIADLHTRSRQVAYRGLYGDHYLDYELAAVSRVVWRRRFETYAPAQDLILAAMESGEPIALAYASFRINPNVGLLVDNLHVAPERKSQGLGSRLLATVARWLVDEHAGAPLHLEVYAPNQDALGFYRRKGGIEVARYRETPPGGLEVDVVRLQGARPRDLLR
jgi:GNAT superfamily N-acetyltransferase